VVRFAPEGIYVRPARAACARLYSEARKMKDRPAPSSPRFLALGALVAAEVVPEFWCRHPCRNDDLGIARSKRHLAVGYTGLLVIGQKPVFGFGA